MNDTATGARRVLVLFAHPALEKSRVNRVLAAGLEDMDGVTFHDLYEAYPDLGIDIAREQELLESHDVVVMQHPLFWYSTPAILKEWQDLVLQHGWAYGSTGNALVGKTMLSAVTSGGAEEAYRPDGYNGHHIRDYLLPLAQTARLCGMTWLAPFLVHGTLHMSAGEMAEHAAGYRRLLAALRDGQVDLETAAAPDLPFINRDLDAVLQGGA